MPSIITRGAASAKAFGMFGKIASAPTTMTFNSGATSSNVTLSNGNKTAQITSSSAGGSKTTYSLSTGKKVMFSLTLNIYSGGSNSQGIGIGASSYANSPGSDLNSVGVYDNGEFYYNGSGVPLGDSFSYSGAIVDLCVDSGANVIWYRVSNGTWNSYLGTGNPATGTLGLTIGGMSSKYPLIFGAWLEITTIGTEWTINTTSPYAVPSGFTFIG